MSNKEGKKRKIEITQSSCPGLWCPFWQCGNDGKAVLSCLTLSPLNFFEQLWILAKGEMWQVISFVSPEHHLNFKSMKQCGVLIPFLYD